MSVEEELRKATDERFAAMAAGDVKALDECLSDDLSYIAAAGAVIGKAEILDNVRSGTFKLESFQTDDFRVKRYGDAAVAVYKTVLTSSFRGQSRRGNYGTTSVYAKERGRWRLVAQQMTLMAPTPQPAPAPVATH
jgi:ketosteroid isomerase-like protein